MTDRFPADPETSRICVVCGTSGTLGQYIDFDDKLVWAHLTCAARKDLEAVDGGVMRDDWEGI